MTEVWHKTLRGAIAGALILGSSVAWIGDASAAGRHAYPIMDMVHHNPGEAPTDSRYLDSSFLRERGFGGKVFFLFDAAQFGVDWQDFDKGVFPEGSAGAAWVAEKADSITARYNAARREGLEVYCMLDMLVLPKKLVEIFRDGICDTEGKIDISRPFTQKCVRHLVRSMFGRFPQLDGLVIRTGETYLHDAPYHQGNHPVRHGMSDHVTLINLLRDDVCERLGKKLFYRTWDMGKLHSLPAHYLSVTDSVKPHPNLFFSVKHTMTDFWRSGINSSCPPYDSFDTYWLDESGKYGIPFNPTLGIGQHRQIVEVQCQREYEGKGAHPNYIAHGVIDGFGELAGMARPYCLSHLSEGNMLGGIWTWSRGGGWGGPYIADEFWIDLNAGVLALWASEPELTEEECFSRFALGRGLPREELPMFRRMCLLTEEGVLKGQYSRYGGTFVNWTRDDNMGGGAFQTGYLDDIISAGKVLEYQQEKDEAVEIWREIERIGASLHFRSDADREFVAVSATYGRIKYEILAVAWEVMMHRRLALAQGVEPDSELLARARGRYDALWEEWSRLKEQHACCPTLYRRDAWLFGE